MPNCPSASLLTAAFRTVLPSLPWSRRETAFELRLLAIVAVLSLECFLGFIVTDLLMSGVLRAVDGPCEVELEIEAIDNLPVDFGG